jgi:tRNA/rRNA methyltransferase
MGYEWFQAADATPAPSQVMPDTRPATRAEVHALFAHFEAALDAAGFLAPPEKKARHGAQSAQSVSSRQPDRAGCAHVSRRSLIRFCAGRAGPVTWRIKPRVAAISQAARADPGAGSG